MFTGKPELCTLISIEQILEAVQLGDKWYRRSG
jgi:hypothetical protein